LRTLGDAEPAALLEDAADAASDAPARPGGPAAAPDGPVPDRAAVLELARQAIDRHLGEHPRPDDPVDPPRPQQPVRDRDSAASS
jgi:hypothetical protein